MELTLSCDDDDCAYRRENGHRYQVIYTTEDLAAFAKTYGSGVIFGEWQKRLLGLRQRDGPFVLSGHKTPGERRRELPKIR